MNHFILLTDCFINILLFLTLDLFLNHFGKCISQTKQLPIKAATITLWIVFSFFPSIFMHESLRAIINFIYSLCIVRGRFKQRLLVYLKHQLYYVLVSAVLAIAYTVLTMDYTIYAENELYANYTSIIGNFSLYIILCILVISKKLSAFPKGRVYKRYFLAIISLIIISLVVCSMLLGSNLLNQEDIAPLLFTLIIFLAFIFLSIFRNIITILEENTIAKIEMEKNAVLQDYFTKVEENLKTTSFLRHDFKNHLIIIQDYANNGKLTELQQYLASIHSNATASEPITTTAPMLSALINTKKEDCKSQGITLDLDLDFQNISMDDFHLVTIFSNMLDNAITASTKAEDKWINLKVIQKHSYIEIDCSNSHREQIKEKNQIFQSTKTDDTRFHGLGIKSIQRAVDDLNGEINFDYTEALFHVNILVPNYA